MWSAIGCHRTSHQVSADMQVGSLYIVRSLSGHAPGRPRAAPVRTRPGLPPLGSYEIVPFRRHGVPDVILKPLPPSGLGVR
jgi:hypothetical protein